MYPQRELTRLADRKAALQRDIVLSRAQCAGAVARIAQPLEWIDRAVAGWRRLSPLAPLAVLVLRVLVKRRVSPRAKFTNALLRWSPLVFAAARGFCQARAQPGSRRMRDRVPSPVR